jgi:hypothetical protein
MENFETSGEISSETALESAEQTDSSTESQESQENFEEQTPQAKKLKKLGLKFNGREEDVELPFEIEESHAEWMKKQLQMAKLGSTKAQEYNQLEKEVSAFLHELKSNPRKALANPAIGIDIKQLAAEILEEEIANAQKSPEQLEKERLEAELKAEREERAKEKKQRQEEEYNRLVEAEYERYDNQISAALQKTDLPKSPYVVNKITDYMIMALQSGRDLPVESVVELAREEILDDIKQMFGVMPAETIEAILGQDNLTKLRKSRVSKAKATPPTPVKSAVKDVAANITSKKQDESKQSFKDFFGI